MEAINGEIYVVPFFGQGHLFPSIELCKQFSLRNYKTTLIIASHLSSSIPSSFRCHHFTNIVEISTATDVDPPPKKDVVVENGSGRRPEHKHGTAASPFHRHHQKMGEGIESYLSTRSDTRAAAYAVMDVMMSWSKEIFDKFGIPALSFMTSGACSAAMKYAVWDSHAEDLKPGTIRVVPELPEDMALSHFDLREARSHKRGGHGGPPEPAETDGPANGKRFGPPGPGERPRWVDEVEGSIGLLINTCDILEGKFIEYINNQIGKPVWGVGPLLPEQYWKSTGSLIRDGQIRSNRKSNHTEDEVVQWLDSKSVGSVIYISFGSEVGPTMEEYTELASALEESNQSFIWVIQPGSGKPGPPRSLFEPQPGPDDHIPEEGYYPNGLDGKVGDNGLIIRGWAPQLLILSHPSTGGFLSHCGWNSTLEAIGRGVPLLAWPIRGDQFFNAKLVARCRHPIF